MGVAELTAFVWAAPAAASPAGAKHSGARNRREETTAAVAIQKSWRASSDRADLTRSLSREAARLREDLGMPLSPTTPRVGEAVDGGEDVETAVIKIQAVVRGSAARRAPSLPDDSSSSGEVSHPHLISITLA